MGVVPGSGINADTVIAMHQNLRDL